ncbi:hypothetical protein AAFF_G00389410 [Aldrovandia affinis]|uniref:Uncharacterized protein n=1 Tax=Aldrovandia affinis TaxID=143900 RepID=A0AAD7SEE8_9TELE|nr:hypothetical protein AAFF_G00389410 [Aldrovandia affinis]
MGLCAGANEEASEPSWRINTACINSSPAVRKTKVGAEVTLFAFIQRMPLSGVIIQRAAPCDAAIRRWGRAFLPAECGGSALKRGQHNVRPIARAPCPHTGGGVLAPLLKVNV